MIELFKTIGLDSDPFTTSPNVEKFFPATQHRQCLEGLELSIRMRRGLSVIRGGIGVGKTTVSRKLIEIFKDDTRSDRCFKYGTPEVSLSSVALYSLRLSRQRG